MTTRDRLSTARSKALAAQGDLVADAEARWSSRRGVAGEIGFDFLIAEHGGRPTLVSAHVSPWAQKKSPALFEME